MTGEDASTADDERRAAHRRTVHFFHPGPSFPSFSMTGSGCAFDCAHCGGRYLENMTDVSDPGALVDRAAELQRLGGTGFLLSGGCGPDGSVDFSAHLGAIADVRERTGLLINAHTCLMDAQPAKELCAAGVDVASVDVVGDRETVRQVYGFDAGPEDHAATLEALAGAGNWRVVPHICLGLMGENETGEIAALDIVTRFGAADALVVITFIPTKGTRMVDSPPITGDRLARFIRRAKAALDVPVVVGCMRPKKGEREEERLALDAGADGLVLPAAATVTHARETGLRVREHPGCCALIPPKPTERL